MSTGGGSYYGTDAAAGTTYTYLVGSSWERGDASTTPAGTHFLDKDTLVEYVCSGLTATGWGVYLGSTPGPDKAGLLIGAGNSVILSTEDLSRFVVDSITMAVVFSYTTQGANTYCAIGQIGSDTTGMYLLMKLDGAGGLNLITYQNAVETILKNYATIAAFVGLHAICVAAVDVAGVKKWRWSIDGTAVADTNMGAAFVTAGTSSNIGFGCSSTTPLYGTIHDMCVWNSTLSNANILAMATLPGTPTYRVPVSSSSGAPSIRCEAARYSPLVAAQLPVKGAARPLVVSTGVRKKDYT